jgi:serine protease
MNPSRSGATLRRATLCLCLCLMGMMGPAQVLAAPEFIVMLHAEASDPEQLQRRAAELVARGQLPLVAERPLHGRWLRLHAERALAPSERLELEQRLRADPRVRAVVPNVREQRQQVLPNDARFGEQWWLQPVGPGNTGAAGFASAWTRSTGMPTSGSGAVVAVLDSGITSHPELNARVLPGWDFVSSAIYAGDGNGRDNDPADPGDAISDAERIANPAAFDGCPPAPVSSWHGTIIAGQLAAVTNNGEGVAAANWAGTVLPVRVAGKCGAAVGDIVDGLRWAAGLAVAGAPANPNPARVVVLSYGGVDPCDVDSAIPSVRDTARLYRDTIAELRAAGALVVVAAGNQRSRVGRPAGCAGAIGVASLNREGYKASYSNFGPEIAIATPGGDGASGGTCDRELGDGGLVSTGNLGTTAPGAAGYAAASGTSFAAPAVAATAALMLAVRPTLGVEQLEAGLRASARPFVRVPLLGACSLVDNRGRCECTATTCGAGMLDADQALRYAAEPSTFVPQVQAPPSLSDSRIEACAALLGRPPAATPPVNPAPPVESAAAGGGAVAGTWLGALLLAVVALRSRRRQ